MTDPFVQETAIVEPGAQIGAGTKIWHHVHVRGGSVIGKDCIIGKGAYIDTKVRIGDACKIQNGANLYHGLTVGDRVFIGPAAQFTNDLVPRAWSWSDEKLVKTVVKNGASIGSNATIVCGTTIGEYAMVAAGSVVTKDVPAYGLVMGNPARLRGFVDRAGNRVKAGRPAGNEVILTVAEGEQVAVPAALAKEVGL